MWTHPHCKKPYDRLRVSDNCINRSVSIRYAIPLPPICWQEVSISERCRSNWATRTCAPPKPTPMYSSRALTGYAAHSPTSRQRYRPLAHRPSLRYCNPCSVGPIPLGYHRANTYDTVHCAYVFDQRCDSIDDAQSIKSVKRVIDIAVVIWALIHEFFNHTMVLPP